MRPSSANTHACAKSPYARGTGGRRARTCDSSSRAKLASVSSSLRPYKHSPFVADRTCELTSPSPAPPPTIDKEGDRSGDAIPAPAPSIARASRRFNPCFALAPRVSQRFKHHHRIIQKSTPAPPHRLITNLAGPHCSAHEFAAHHCAYRFRRLDCWFTGGRPGRFNTAVVPVCTVLLLELQRLALVPSSSSGCSFPRASWRAWTLAGSISIGRSPAI